MRTDELFKHTSKLQDFSSALMALAEHVPERMTLAQTTFFLLAGIADISGRPTTFTAIKEASGDTINRSLHSTYKVLLEGPNRKDRPNPRQKGLNWLKRESNPQDEREKFLRLTPEGRAVLVEVIKALANDHHPEN